MLRLENLSYVRLYFVLYPVLPSWRYRKAVQTVYVRKDLGSDTATFIWEIK